MGSGFKSRGVHHREGPDQRKRLVRAFCFVRVVLSPRHVATTAHAAGASIDATATRPPDGIVYFQRSRPGCRAPCPRSYNRAAISATERVRVAMDSGPPCPSFSMMRSWLPAQR
jgi:hypothetical protein